MIDQIASAQQAPRRDVAYRLVDLYRRTTASRSALALVIANAIPLVGVLLFGWSLWTILVLYWLDNGITGFWTIPKILMARGSMLRGLGDAMPFADERTRSALRMMTSAQGPSAAMEKAFGPLTSFGQAGRVALTFFFLIHYGMFWFVHGIFVFAIPAFFSGFETGEARSAFGEINGTSVLIGGVALFLSHGYSYFRDYLGRDEYLRTSAAAQMSAPYGRVVVLHLTILLGAFGVAFLGASEIQLLVFVVLKTLLDLSLHLRQHGPDRPEVFASAPA
jgi:hypothetical protein